MRLASQLLALLAAPAIAADQPYYSLHNDNGTVTPPEGYKMAVFGMGCFWCAEADFEKHVGCVRDVVSGYAGGTTGSPQPTYYDTIYGRSDHVEVIRLFYPDVPGLFYNIALFALQNTDPTNTNGQFCDNGNSYKPLLFYLDDSQKADIDRAVQEGEKVLGAGQIKSEIIEFDGTFWDAEDYHQEFWRSAKPSCSKYGGNCRWRYDGYRLGCGRDNTRQNLWGSLEPLIEAKEVCNVDVNGTAFEEIPNFSAYNKELVTRPSTPDGEVPTEGDSTGDSTTTAAGDTETGDDASQASHVAAAGLAAALLVAMHQ